MYELVLERERDKEREEFVTAFDTSNRPMPNWTVLPLTRTTQHFLNLNYCNTILEKVFFFIADCTNCKWLNASLINLNLFYYLCFWIIMSIQRYSFSTLLRQSCYRQLKCTAVHYSYTVFLCTLMFLISLHRTFIQTIQIELEYFICFFLCIWFMLWLANERCKCHHWTNLFLVLGNCGQ